MNKPAFRQPGLNDLSSIPREDLEALVTKLVETGRVPAEEINGVLDNLREITGVRAKIVSGTVEKQLSPEQQETLIGTLKTRFEANRMLHEEVQWSAVEKALKQSPEKLWSLRQLETTGGAPDIIGEEEGDFVFGDCSAESPSGRRNTVLDEDAEDYLKKIFPEQTCNGNAADSAKEMGVDIMDEDQYRSLQKKLPLDKKTSSRLKTPADIRKSGHALVGYNAYDVVRVYQCNAHSSYDTGAWRAVLKVPKV